MNISDDSIQNATVPTGHVEKVDPPDQSAACSCCSCGTCQCVACQCCACSNCGRGA